MHLKQKLILLSTLLLLFSCNSSQVDNSNLHKAIVTVNEKFMENVSSGNSAGLASLYTENGQLLPTNSAVITGKQAIQGFWQGGLDMGIKSIKLEIIEVDGFETMAFEVGKYTVFAEGDHMIDTGKYIVIWKQEDGKWKLHRDIWNTSMAAQK